MKYFALNFDGSMHYLGIFENWGDAEESTHNTKIDAIWLMNENEAKSWANFINETLQTTESTK
jgi:hypothetical protein